VLQLDVIWTAEFAAAGWIRPLDDLSPDLEDFFPAAVQASRWRGALYAVPWFVDVGLLPSPSRSSAFPSSSRSVSRSRWSCTRPSVAGA
jgi:hypothetical protein